VGGEWLKRRQPPRAAPPCPAPRRAQRPAVPRCAPLCPPARRARRRAAEARRAAAEARRRHLGTRRTAGGWRPSILRNSRTTSRASPSASRSAFPRACPAPRLLPSGRARALARRRRARAGRPASALTRAGQVLLADHPLAHDPRGHRALVKPRLQGAPNPLPLLSLRPTPCARSPARAWRPLPDACRADR